jgi:hypothetical protein
LKVLKITIDNNDDGALYLDSFDNLGDYIGPELKYYIIGTEFKLKVIDMSKEDFDKLPEWNGW